MAQGELDKHRLALWTCVSETDATIFMKTQNGQEQQDEY